MNIVIKIIGILILREWGGEKNYSYFCFVAINQIVGGVCTIISAYTHTHRIKIIQIMLSVQSYICM